MERKVFIPQFKFEDTGDRLLLSAFISTERPDRCNDIVRVSGMRISGKPSVLFSHGMSPHIGTEPVGRILDIGKSEFGGYPGIKARIELYPDDTGKRLFGKIKGGYLHSMSIGYRTLESKPRPNGGKDLLVWDLLEASFVSTPMQPDAQVIETNAFTGMQVKFMPDRTEKLRPESMMFPEVKFFFSKIDPRAEKLFSRRFLKEEMRIHGIKEIAVSRFLSAMRNQPMVFISSEKKIIMDPSYPVDEMKRRLNASNGCSDLNLNVDECWGYIFFHECCHLDPSKSEAECNHYARKRILEWRAR